MRQLIILFVLIGIFANTKAESNSISENAENIILNNGELTGTVVDSESGEALIYADVILETASGKQNTTITNLDGVYNFKLIPPGTYTLYVTYNTYETYKEEDLVIGPSTILVRDIKLVSSFQIAPTATIIGRKKRITPLVLEVEPMTTTTLSKNDIKRMPSRGLVDFVSMSAGTYQSDSGEGIQVRGSRPGKTLILVDGMKVNSLRGVPANSINVMQTITGGLPAKYGDTTSGAIIITTRSYFTE